MEPILLNDIETRQWAAPKTLQNQQNILDTLPLLGIFPAVEESNVVSESSSVDPNSADKFEGHQVHRHRHRLHRRHYNHH